MNIIGISSFFHDSACCLIQNGQLVGAVQEERFSRIKNDPRLPIRAFRYCLSNADMDITDIDCIAYYESPREKLSRQIWSNIQGSADPDYSWLDPIRPETSLREIFGFEGPIKFFDHHKSHAAASYFFSGFDEAGVYISDAVGEWTTTSFSTASSNDLTIQKEIKFPDSLGLFYSTITQFLGFKVLSGEYKVMGLAPYGRPTFVPQLKKLISWNDRGDYFLNPCYFDFSGKGKMYKTDLLELLGCKPRKHDSNILPVHKDIARSLQRVLEEILLCQIKHLRTYTDSDNLCLGGGVALNCVANGRILRESEFKNLFIQPAAGDAGSSIGAAVLAHVELTGKRPAQKSLPHVYLGPGYDNEYVEHVLNSTGIKYKSFAKRTDELLKETVDRLIEGKVIAWFQGSMEFGPRALGGRSILADPRRSYMRDHINKLIKKREAFRPFAPAILEEYMDVYMKIEVPSPFMLTTCQVKSGNDLPAITHIDGSCRPQTVGKNANNKFRLLINAFYIKTGCPILVNTSFNVRDEPIVCSPNDALRCMANSEIDTLVIEDYIVDRVDNIDNFKRGAELMLNTMAPKNKDEISDTAYTFI
ncbi:MAG: carbamoyltransferase C-terminal domain-containing protein [Bacteroidota bacterium]